MDKEELTREMAFFKNREKRTIAQLEDYYASRHSSGKAWAMAFLSLFITVVVLSGIFFGGRWLFRTLTNDDVTISTSGSSSQVEGSIVPGVYVDEEGQINGEVQISEEGQVDVEDQDQPGLEIVSIDEPSELEVDESSSDENTTEVTVGVVSDEAASTSIPNTISSQTSEDAGQTAGDSTENAAGELPDTGAGELLLLAPMLAAVAGYAFSIRRQTAKL